LVELADAGITLLEIMPVADFSGRWGWGYDGVDLFAPSRLYGSPDDCRRFVNQAHELGLGVILDVVYNHVGSNGNYLAQFSPAYFTERYTTDWGPAINFDGECAGPVREFFLANAGYWIDEFHFDGLRLDATQNIYDTSSEHILAAIARRVRQAARGRATLLVAENEPQQTQLVRPPSQGGYGLDALWNDDFHHSATVALTGHTEAYYSDYRGTPQEFISALKWGYLYQGQYYRWQRQRRGTPCFGLTPATFVTYLQNHDQIANSAYGLRLQFLTSPGRYRAMTALLLLGPGTPMLFQGQEFAASSPFYFFADYQGELASPVRRGRVEFLSQFPSLALPETQARLPDPIDPATFTRSKLDLSERQRHAEAYALHCDLLRLRRQDAVFRNQRPGGVDGAVLSASALVLRFFADDGHDRLLVMNLGGDLYLHAAPEPLLAPPARMQWEILWTSDHPRYGGSGTPPLETMDYWRIPGETAVVLMPKPQEEVSHA
jgi:maltooligosyltrehalose trehalohydrolase